MISTWLQYGFINLLLTAIIAYDDSLGVNFLNFYGTNKGKQNFINKSKTNLSPKRF